MCEQVHMDLEDNLGCHASATITCVIVTSPPPPSFPLSLFSIETASLSDLELTK